MCVPARCEGTRRGGDGSTPLNLNRVILLSLILFRAIIIINKNYPGILETICHGKKLNIIYAYRQKDNFITIERPVRQVEYN